VTSRFYNPYFFLPVLRGREDGGQSVEFNKLRDGSHHHIRHDLYHPGYLTGYLICTLTTKTPTFVGNERIAGIKRYTAGKAGHYAINGSPAFPASSLNGMIGSLMEALSNSALRVLADEKAKELLEKLEDGHNLLPWKGKRTHLTPAELILGAVAEEEGGSGGDGEVYSFAGRVRFSDAEKTGRGEVKTLGVKMLKILSSPRPVTDKIHNFYFHKKSALSSEDKTVINGRKYYLHHRPQQMSKTGGKGKYWWETKDACNVRTIHQKTCCDPVAKGQKFRFHICFHNLSEAELGLLLAALDPVRADVALNRSKATTEEEEAGRSASSGKFLHRLGFGKPLGLGTVKIGITQLWLETVETSYTSWAPDPFTKDGMDCIDHCLDAAVAERLIDETVLKALLELGDPAKIDARVTYPVTRQQYEALEKGEAEGEQRLFQWFVENKPYRGVVLVGDDFWYGKEPQSVLVKLPALNGHE